MADLEELQSEITALKEQNTLLQKTLKGYETVLKLNDQEISNLEEIVTMYENMIEFSRQELVDARESIKASEVVRDLSRDELIKAVDLIKALEEKNKQHKQKRAEVNKQISQ